MAVASVEMIKFWVLSKNLLSRLFEGQLSVVKKAKIFHDAKLRFRLRGEIHFF